MEKCEKGTNQVIFLSLVYITRTRIKLGNSEEKKKREKKMQVKLVKVKKTLSSFI